LKAGVDDAVELDHKFSAIQQIAQVQHVVYIQHETTWCTERHNNGKICRTRGIDNHRGKVNGINPLFEVKKVAHAERRGIAGKFQPVAILPAALIYSTVGGFIYFFEIS